MNTITFSHRYEKMPAQVEYLSTYIEDVRQKHFRDLTNEEIDQDTKIVGGGHYTLPNTDLIHIKLWSLTINGPVRWATYRPYTKEKFEYYWGLRGSEVKIEIKP